MKYILMLLLTILFFISCEKTSEDNKNYDFILAGESTSDNTIYSGVVDSLLDVEYYGSHVESNEYLIDFEQFGNIGLKIIAGSSGGQGGYSRKLFLKSLDSNILISIDSMDYIKVHNSDDMIDKELIWSSSETNSFLSVNQGYDHQAGEPYYIVNGNWTEMYDKYVGFSIIENSDTAYGWIRLNVFEDSKIFIQDFAYR